MRLRSLNEPALVLAKVAKLLTDKNESEASATLQEGYAFVPWKKPLPKRDVESASTAFTDIVETPQSRKYTQKESLQVFSEDGFLDRYSGSMLICPAALYAIAYALPDEFPWDGARIRSHQGLWDLFPTIDHIYPVSRGGLDIRDNWVTTSMTLNMKKGNESMSELGWSIYDAGNFSEWDGLVSWYVEFSLVNPEVESVRNNKGWHKATIDLYG